MIVGSDALPHAGNDGDLASPGASPPGAQPPVVECEIASATDARGWVCTLIV